MPRSERYIAPTRVNRIGSCGFERLRAIVVLVGKLGVILYNQGPALMLGPLWGMSVRGTNRWWGAGRPEIPFAGLN